MTLLEIIKLILKHKILLIVAPLVMAILAIVLTINPKFDYETQAIVYTGIASGTSVEVGKKSDYFASNTAFDNLINIIKSRETQEEVAVRLLAQHLLLEEPERKYISEKHFAELQELVPKEINQYIVKDFKGSKIDTLGEYSSIIPTGVSYQDYERTVANLMNLKESSNDNFIYKLLNYDHPFYSLKAVSTASALRIGSSDLIKLGYKTGDPGICKQTLSLYVFVCKRKYKDFKENGSDAVVQYFSDQLKLAENKLKKVESELLKYNQENSIINYYEQSKAVAVVREDMEVAYKNKLAELAGSIASKKELEKKLLIQQEILEKNDEVLRDKQKLGDLNYKIVIAEAKSDGSPNSLNKIIALKEEAKNLQIKIDKGVNELFAMNNSLEGVPMKKMIPQWVDNLVNTENLAAEVELMTKQSKEFQKEVEKYAPAGANIKRIEREISVIEEEYLEILRGLNLAKLKYQDTQIAGNLKMVDPPYFPLNPIPSKRKIIIVAVAFLSFIMILGTILVMEFFDKSLKNDEIAKEKIGLESLGMLSKITIPNGKINLVKIQNRLMDFLMLNLEHQFTVDPELQNKTKIITVISTNANEGKTIISGNIAKKFKSFGKNVLYLNHSDENKKATLKNSNAWLTRLLGYQDPRIDYSSDFLEDVNSYLDPSEYQIYTVNNLSRIDSYKDLNFNKHKVDLENLDYVIIELPNILEQNYPAALLKKSDLTILVARSNRLWNKADENIISNIKEIIGEKIQFVLNGVDIDELESVLGEIPKNRSSFRKKMKNLFRLQFNSRNKI